MQEPAPQNSPKAKLMTRAAVQHAAPFILWIGILLLASMMHLNESSGTEDIQSLNLISDASLYAIRTGLCTLLFLLLRPWRYYPALQKKQILPAIGLGTAIFALWVGFESAAFKVACPQLATFYETWCVMPFGELREPLDATAPYAPAFCGWSLSLIRLLSSAITISIIEEF